MHVRTALVVVVLVVLGSVWSAPPPCRFAHQYSANDLLTNPDIQQQFMEDVMYYEGQFHQDQIGYNALSGLTYDGRAINITTGEVADGLHEFSASSKESVHVNLLSLALNGSTLAQIFISPENFSDYEDKAIEILTNKITSYENFNARYPGFGGFFPWFYNYNGTTIMVPTDDFASRTPSLDNGQLAWALYALANVLNVKGYTALSKRYFAQVQLMATNALTVFYAGDGHTRTVASIHNITGPCVASNYYGIGYLDDPYEGELFTFFMDLFSTWPNPEEREKVWIYKRALLQSVDFQSPSGPITVQKGWWYSSHEMWKFMVLPYLDVERPNRVFMNGERARTINSAMTSTPGLHASTNDVSDTLYIPDYVSDSGITSISFNPAFRTDIITPYGAFPVVLANLSVGLVWYHNMLSAPKMQGPHGSTEAILVNGTLIAPLVTWDTKITTVNAMLGGITRLTSAFMEKDGVLERFQYVAQREYSLAFPILSGEEIPFALPQNTVPEVLTDFTLCN